MTISAEGRGRSRLWKVVGGLQSFLQIDAAADGRSVVYLADVGGGSNGDARVGAMGLQEESFLSYCGNLNHKRKQGVSQDEKK